MKFSYKLIKKYLPDIPSKEDLVRHLNMHSFETEMADGDIFDITVPSNRYSSAAYHIGVAREAAAVLGLNDSKIPDIEIEEWKGESEEFELEVKDEKLCPRYTGWYFDDVEVGPSPDWLQKILEDCGLRPINNVVDVMNYVMLETGQPLHAFDYDKIEDHKIVVRKANKEESMTSIEGVDYDLNPDILVIADSKKPIAIAGIKGGKDAEVTENTERIIVESASFDPISIYETSKNINLTTDASLRFAHAIHKQLALIGLERAGEILQKVVGAEPGGRLNSAPETENPKEVSFDPSSFNKLMGTSYEDKDINDALTKLGFGVNEGKVVVPVLRGDIENEADLIEEAGRIFGFDEIEAQAPKVSIKPSREDDMFVFRDEVRRIMTGLGYDEVYNYSFVGDSSYGEVELENPISEEKSLLRSTLTSLMLGNVEENLKYYDEARIFEVGRVFEKSEERNVVGIAFGSREKETFFEVKGVVDELLRKLGLTDFHTVEVEDEELKLEVHADGNLVGYIIKYGKGFTFSELKADLLMDLVEGEISFEELPKYPAVLRDVSILVDKNTRIGNVIQEVQIINMELIEDVDLIDEYLGISDEKQSITLRIRFRHSDKTLSAEEVDEEMDKITSMLEKKFGAKIR